MRFRVWGFRLLSSMRLNFADSWVEGKLASALVPPALSVAVCPGCTEGPTLADVGGFWGVRHAFVTADVRRLPRVDHPFGGRAALQPSIGPNPLRTTMRGSLADFSCQGLGCIGFRVWRTWPAKMMSESFSSHEVMLPREPRACLP